MKYSNRQIKIFKRILLEFSKEYTRVTTERINLPDLNQDSLFTFYNEVKKNVKHFTNCDSNTLKKITLLKDFDPKKAKIQWISLHNLFLILYDNKDQYKESLIKDFNNGRLNPKTTEESADSSTENFTPSFSGMNSDTFNPALISQMLPLITNMMSGSVGDKTGNNAFDNPIFSNLIQETSDTLMNSLKGKEHQLKDINPMDLFSQLMNGNNIVGGIDLNDTIKSIQVSITSKIENNEIDPQTFKDSAESIIKTTGIDPKMFQQKIEEIE